MMRSNSQLDPSLANRAIPDLSLSGRMALWPGPLLFFSYGYDLSDYVKVGPNETGPVESGAEVDMSKAEIWSEIERLREALPPKSPQDVANSPRGSYDADGKPSEGPCADGQLVWKWKIKEHGTSMKILDVGRREFQIMGSYLVTSPFNPYPPLLQPIPGGGITKVSYLDHPAYAGASINLLEPTRRRPGSALISKGARCPPQTSPFQAQPQIRELNDLVFESLMTHRHYPQSHPMAGAFAVGLRWFVHHVVEFNPPFRAAVFPSPTTTRLRHSRRMTNLLWTLHACMDPGDSSPSTTSPSLSSSSSSSSSSTDHHHHQQQQQQQQQQQPLLQLQLHRPPTLSPTEGLVICHASLRAIQPHHVHALAKYLDFTDPREWARRGRRGFEAYWAVYARTERQRQVGLEMEAMVTVGGPDRVGAWCLEGLEDDGPYENERAYEAAGEDPNPEWGRGSGSGSGMVDGPVVSEAMKREVEMWMEIMAPAAGQGGGEGGPEGANRAGKVRESFLGRIAEWRKRRDMGGEEGDEARWFEIGNGMDEDTRNHNKGG
ncbi:hypothetical protein VTK26DRAFT_6372 [Humicola hyalothermophila]